MLSHTQQMRLSNPYYNEDYVSIYWNQLQQLSNITEKQCKLLLKLSDMPKKQQNNYVIIDDQLVLAPTKQRVYSSVSGEWKRSRIHEGNNRKR